jgi:geranylgeranyl diphosphate synthase type II
MGQMLWQVNPAEMKLRKIEDLLEILESRFTEYQQNNSFTPSELYDPVFYSLSNGGKRIRPILLLLGLNLFSDSIEEGITSAMAVEIFHNFTLLHDDIMDNSFQRRNKPTVHKKWGVNTAILSGDAMMIMAYQLLGKSPENKLSSLMKVFSKAALEVCEGQQFDMNFEHQSSVSESDYIEMIRLKTSVLLAASLQMGAILGNADQEDQENLYRFGMNLGLSFQLQDDYLDTFGNQAVFGKRIGNDILANKKTYLLIKAWENSTGETREKLQYWLEAENFDEQEKIEQVTSIYDQLSVACMAREKIGYFHQLSLEALKKVKVKEERKKVLFDLAEQLIVRNN